MRMTGRPPEFFGKKLERSKLYEAASIMSVAFQLGPLLIASKQGGSCPLLGG